MTSEQDELLGRAVAAAESSDSGKAFALSGHLLEEVLRIFPPRLRDSRIGPSQIYSAALHVPTQSLVIWNRGAALLTCAPYSGTYSSVYHIGVCVIAPGWGVETVNLGFSGACEAGQRTICRVESACAPSFFFGSQRCNCADQWSVSREIAGRLNPWRSTTHDPIELEKRLRASFSAEPDGTPRSLERGRAVILMHLDSQAGMGSGATSNEFTPELAAVAAMRHRGEYSVEQLFDASMAGAFEQLGLVPDPRRLREGFGYQIPAIVLDCVSFTGALYLLTNNPMKADALRTAGFDVMSRGICGRRDAPCELETLDRRQEFHHDIPRTEALDPKDEVEAILNDIECLG